MTRQAFVCECGYWTTVGRLDVGMDECEADEKGLICPDCGETLADGVHKSNGTIGIFSQEERVSLAMGVHPSQIKEAEKAFPGSRYRADGALLYMGRTGQKQAMKQRGYVNYN